MGFAKRNQGVENDSIRCSRRAHVTMDRLFIYGDTTLYMQSLHNKAQHTVHHTTNTIDKNCEKTIIEWLEAWETTGDYFVKYL